MPQKDLSKEKLFEVLRGAAIPACRVNLAYTDPTLYGQTCLAIEFENEAELRQFAAVASNLNVDVGNRYTTEGGPVVGVPAFPVKVVFRDCSIVD